MLTQKKILLLTAVCLFFSSTVYAENVDGENRFDQEIDESDFKAVKLYVESKRLLTLEEKAGNLSISGDVRAEWRYTTQKQRGENIRGGDGVFVFYEEELVNDEIYQVGERLPLSKNQFNVEFNLKVDYTADCAWAMTHVAYYQTCGVDDNGLEASIDPEGYHGSGSCDNLCLKQAYIGYNLIYANNYRFDVELGRIGNLYYVFDSEIQFLSRLDGILFTFQHCWDGFADWYVQCAGFVVDERVNQFAWIAEVGFLDICGTGFDFKYSFIDWVKYGENRCFVRNPIGFKFMNSQFTLAYHLKPNSYVEAPVKLYGAFLWNHTPAEYTYINGVLTHIGRQNLGWYAGFRVGEVYCEGDWAFGALYAVVQAQCMPDNDVRKIGTGNALQESFTAEGFGNTNWKGWQFTALYALTDNLAIYTLIEHSTTYDKKIAGNNIYNNFKLEAIYAF